MQFAEMINTLLMLKMPLMRYEMGPKRMGLNFITIQK